MKKPLKFFYMLFQILFYIFSGLTIIAFIFSLFGSEPYKTVGYLLLSTIAFLITYSILYRVYTHFYVKEEVKTLPDYMDDLKHQ